MINNGQNTNQLIEYPSNGIISKELIKNDKADVTLFCMAAGTEISEHTAVKDGLVYVVEGEGVFNLAGSDIKMEPGVLIFMGANSIHSLKSFKNTSFLLILINR